jgi:hypothetical protein
VTIDLPRPRVAGETDLEPRFIELKRELEAPLRAGGGARTP